MAFIQHNNPCPITSCGRRRIERVKDIYTKRKSRKAKKLKQNKKWKKRKKDLVVGKVIERLEKRNHLVVKKLKVVELKW